jgi:sodium/proline symporter
MSRATLATFIAYFILVLAVGWYSRRRSRSIEDYLLGGRRMGALVTAISAEASDMSGWLLMGLPGAIYLGGMKNIWIAVGIFLGTVLNWVLVAARLRLYTQRTNTITLPRFFEERFADPTGLLRTASAVVILIFFTIYASSGLVAAGKLFESTFGISYVSAVVIGGLVTIGYTFLGGYFAVCWTDVFQGLLMVSALVVVPSVACFQSGGTAIGAAMTEKGIQAELIPNWAASTLLGTGSALAWGLGYFGQPHVLTRFMSVRSLAKLRQSMVIAVLWVLISLTGAVVIGFVGLGMFDYLRDGEQEKVFIYMIQRVMPPLLAGIMLAAIMAAIMSTIDSQLLVSSSALTEDLPRRQQLANPAAPRTTLWGRVCVVVISALAMGLALRPNETILGIVAYAWGGFGAAFGPLVLFALFSRRATWQAALAGMITGTVVLVIWKQAGLSEHLYEIVPGFLANSLVIWVTNRVIQQEDSRVLRQFDEVVEEARGAGAPTGREELDYGARV